MVKLGKFQVVKSLFQMEVQNLCLEFLLQIINKFPLSNTSISLKPPTRTVKHEQAPSRPIRAPKVCAALLAVFAKQITSQCSFFTLTLEI